MDEAAGHNRHGGWITFPFIIGTLACLTLATGGWVSNLIVYLMQEFNIKSIGAAKIFNFVNGSITMFPIVGAIIADSFAGCFPVIWFSSLISLVGTLLLVLTASIPHLKPPHTCVNGTSSCKHPSSLQSAVLYLALALSSLGSAGTRFTIAPMGADQFESSKHQRIFFNWYIFTMYTATVISSTALVYIEDNVSWAWGFILCAVANVLGLAVFLGGTRFYRLVRPRGSPFISIAHVLTAALRKREMVLSQNQEDYYHEVLPNGRNTAKNPTSFLRFLNRAALRTEGDIITNPWRHSTVQQVEDLKNLLKLFPIWSTGLFLSIPLAIQLSLTILQALTMDRRIVYRLKIPAGTLPVFILVSTSLAVFIIDRLLFPLWERFCKTPPSLLGRIGIGHVLTIMGMAVSALVEMKRLRLAESMNGQNQTDAIVPISVFWLVPQLAIVGIGEAFHFPGNVAFYYEEFPESMKSTSTAVVALLIGVAFYISNGLIDLVGRITRWLPDNINEGRLDNVYWVCCAVAGLNFGYYLGCASLYRYQNIHKQDDSGER